MWNNIWYWLVKNNSYYVIGNEQKVPVILVDGWHYNLQLSGTIF
jgi:hypothetical protein